MTRPLQEVHLQLQFYYFSKNWTQCCTAIITYQSFADRTGILYHITPNLYIHVKNMKFFCNVHGINSVLVSVSLCNTSRKVEWNWTTRARSTWDCGEATEFFACIWLLVSLGLYGIFRHWTDDTNKSLDIHLMCLFTCSAIVQQNMTQYFTHYYSNYYYAHIWVVCHAECLRWCNGSSCWQIYVPARVDCIWLQSALLWNTLEMYH